MHYKLVFKINVTILNLLYFCNTDTQIRNCITLYKEKGPTNFLKTILQLIVDSS